MGARPDIFEDLRRVGALKRNLLDRQPSDNALGRHIDVQVSRDTVGAWLRGERFPQQLEPLLAALAQIRAEAGCRGLLDTPVDPASDCTVTQLLAPDRWRTSWEDEQKRRIQGNRDAAERQRAQAALEDNERRVRQAALADRSRPVGSWSAQRLGVHPAIPGRAFGADGAEFVLPRYVPRPHDINLREHLSDATVVGAQPRMVVVLGASCTGKTRTAFEAVREAVPDDFNLLSPADAGGLLEVLAADAVGPRTVVWLNEAQDYLAGPKGEAVAAGLLRRLDAEGPVVVVATLWPNHDQTLTQRPAPDAEDRHRKARELLAQALYTRLPDSFAADLDAVREAAREDRSLLVAVEAGGADLTQALAAGPDLVAHYEHPVGEYGVYGRALISVAMDAHRLGAAGPLPLDFLEAAVPGYLTDAERAVAAPDWFTGALAYARALIKQTTRSLQDVPRPSGMGAQPNVVRLADYLQQHGRRTRSAQCPPASFWDAATAYLTAPTDLIQLGDAARNRARFHHAARLFCAAAEAGDISALGKLARWREEAGDRAGAERLYRAAADAGDRSALGKLARRREEAGDRAGAERLYRAAADAGDNFALMELARWREEAGDRAGAERLYRAAADAGDNFALTLLVRSREKAGDRAEAERLALQAADAGDRFALEKLVRLREEAGDRAGAERLYRAAADAGHGSALGKLARWHEEAGDRAGAERLALQAADAGHNSALMELARWREEAGDRAGAERLYRAAADAGDNFALTELARLRTGMRRAYARYGLDADGIPAKPWEWPEPRVL